MVNKSIIQGRLTKNPELKKTQSGVERLLFTVAWSEKYKEVEKKCFMLCQAWRGTAKFISDYFAKGKEIVVEGQMVTETWGDKEVTFLSIDKAHFCGSSSGSGTPAPTPAKDNDGFMHIPDAVDDEELPFN